MEQITKNIYKIGEISNIYLILGETTLIIDAGHEKNKKLIKEEIESIIPIEKIKILLFTHLHYDHIGNTDLFKNAKLYADEREINDYKGSSNDSVFGKISKESSIVLKEKLEPLPETILGLNIIKCPGHTRGSVAFLDEKDKLLFSGDCLFHNGIGRTDFQNSLPNEMEKSVNNLLKFINEKKFELLPGHNY